MKIKKSFLLSTNEIPIGSFIEAFGITSNDFVEYFGAPKIEGLYLGDSFLYKNNKIYKIDKSTIRILKKPTEKSIKKANDILLRYLSNEKKIKENIESNRVKVIEDLKKVGFKIGEHGINAKLHFGTNEYNKFGENLLNFNNKYKGIYDILIKRKNDVVYSPRKNIHFPRFMIKRNDIENGVFLEVNFLSF